MVNLLVILQKIVFFITFKVDRTQTTVVAIYLCVLQLFISRMPKMCEILQLVFYYIIDLLGLFQKRSFVLSSEHENQNIATIGTLYDQFMLSCK